MREVVLYIGMSLDGFIADPAGGVDWMQGDGSEPEHPGSYPEFFRTVDTVLLGYRTYRQITTELSPDTWAYSGKKTYVLTHRTLPPQEEIVFTDLPAGELLKKLKQQDGERIWVCGGACGGSCGFIPSAGTTGLWTCSIFAHKAGKRPKPGRIHKKVILSCRAA